jgi:hypothetical protein
VGAVVIVGLPIGAAMIGCAVGLVAGLYFERPADLPGMGGVFGAVVGAAAGGLVGLVAAAGMVG